MRAGIGWDVHKLVKNRKLILGGLDIPFKKGLEGYSDADVLIHAIIDSILGAMAAGDIGTYFPPGAPKYKNISSMKLLSEVKRIMKRKKFSIVNIDSTIIAEKPKLMPYAPLIVKNIAKTLSIPPSAVNVKAKTAERLGYIGKGKAIAASAVCLLKRGG